MYIFRWLLRVFAVVAVVVAVVAVEREGQGEGG